MARPNLILHTGAKAVSLETVIASHTPDETDTHVPIPHGEFLSLVRSQLENLGFRTGAESYGLTEDGNRFFGLVQIESENREYARVLGIRNSHDKKFPAGLVIGSSVFVCDNLSFSGEEKVNRKHTVFIRRDLPGLTARMVGRLGAQFAFQEARFAAYKTREIGIAEARDLIFRGYHAGAFPKTHLADIEGEFMTPRHDEFKAPTAWSLFNAATEIAKGNLIALPGRTMALHALLDELCGVKPVTIEV